mmetsp:Transcript_15433/g.46568  ORF Transcript_15433/g.46568 Transcript_15433/m.46568 type:complete len:209 (+) Transcript_15433:1592-2218(+)
MYQRAVMLVPIEFLWEETYLQGFVEPIFRRRQVSLLDLGHDLAVQSEREARVVELRPRAGACNPRHAFCIDLERRHRYRPRDDVAPRAPGEAGERSCVGLQHRFAAALQQRTQAGEGESVPDGVAHDDVPEELRQNSKDASGPQGPLKGSRRVQRCGASACRSACCSVPMRMPLGVFARCVSTPCHTRLNPTSSGNKRKRRCLERARW